LYKVIGEQTIADAILDRVVHNAYRIELKGESLRKINNQKGGKRIKTLTFNLSKQLFTLFEKQQLRVVSLQRYRVVNMCVFSNLTI